MGTTAEKQLHFLTAHGVPLGCKPERVVKDRLVLRQGALPVTQQMSPGEMMFFVTLVCSICKFLAMIIWVQKGVFGRRAFFMR